MRRKIILAVTYIIGGLSILWTIAGHVNYENFMFNKYGPKFGTALVEQHLYSTMLIVGFFVAVIAVVTYFLREKKK